MSQELGSKINVERYNKLFLESKIGTHIEKNKYCMCHAEISLVIKKGRGTR